MDANNVLTELGAKLGEVVLLPVKERGKAPIPMAWSKLTFKDTTTEEYLAQFNNGCNIGVLLGKPSNGLCTIDLDTLDAYMDFTACNPKLEVTLQSAAQRGANLWFRIKGDYPKSSKIKQLKESGVIDIGEWRADGNQTVIHGIHPEGKKYHTKNERPLEIEFADIVWPPNWQAPFIKPKTEASDPLTAPILIIKDKPVPNEVGVAREMTKLREIVYDDALGQFFIYNERNGLWEEKSQHHVKSLFAERMRDYAIDYEAPQLVTKGNSFLNSVTEVLKGQTEKEGAFDDQRNGIIHAQNGVLDLSQSPPELFKFHPSFVSLTQCEVSFEKDATCPRFLNDLVKPALSADDISLLQRCAGALFMGKNIAQRVPLFMGEPGSGKSTIVEILERLFGQRNVVELRTNLLGERFEIGRYFGKRLLVGKDVRFDFLNHAGATCLKKLSGNDLVSGERKNSNDVFMLRGNFHIFITSNARLSVRLEGDTGAWRRRLIVFRFKRETPPQRVTEFASLLLDEEGSGILNWIIEGALAAQAEFEDYGDFVLTDKQHDAVDDLLSESDSVRTFIKRSVEKMSGSQITVDRLTTAYMDFCSARDWRSKSIKACQAELTDLMLELFGVGKSNSLKDANGNTVRGYYGVRLNLSND